MTPEDGTADAGEVAETHDVNGREGEGIGRLVASR
jgi:hypothetical protein